MLTNDLVRARTKKGQVYPDYLDATSPEALERAEGLVEIFSAKIGAARSEIDGAVDEVVGYGTDFVLWRGLAKLLYDRSKFEVVAGADPIEIRRTVFELAAIGGGAYDEDRRTAVISEAAARLGIEPHECEEGLYADLEQRQILISFKALTPVELLQRYNLALAQAILYRATRLTITLGDQDSNRLRYLFQALKFHRLMHRVKRIEGGYEITLDGPSSLMSKSRKYGLQMAKFLPALVHAGTFRLVADLEGKKGSRELFELTSEQGLVSHYKMRGQWVSKEEKYFEERFEKLDTDWILERRGTVLNLDDNEVIIADYVLRGPDDEEVYVEIVGFWRIPYLQSRIDKLAQRATAPLVLVVSERLKTGRAKLENAPPEVIFFKGVILADKVLAAAKALTPASP